MHPLLTHQLRTLHLVSPLALARTVRELLDQSPEPIAA